MACLWRHRPEMAIIIGSGSSISTDNKALLSASEGKSWLGNRLRQVTAYISLQPSPYWLLAPVPVARHTTDLSVELLAGSRLLHYNGTGKVGFQ